MDELMSFEEALASVDDALAGLRVETETLPVAQAAGRVLARDAVSRLELPPFNKSAMDGYAIMADDERDEYRVLENIPAGNMPSMPLEPGCATKVMTGAPVPEGAAQVIMIEWTDEGDDVVKMSRHGGKSNICIKGEDVQVGRIVLAKGAKLNALAAANLIACGIEQVEVSRRVRVAVLSTGDEIVDSFAAISPGKIMDSNSPMLDGLAREHGLEVVHRAIVTDEREALAAAISECADLADLTILSGGVSAGDFDFVPAAMTDAGFSIHFGRVAVQPGKPVTFATREGAVALGLPGNPVSVFVGFHFFVLRVADLISGATLHDTSFAVRLRADFKRRRANRKLFLPAVLGADGLVDAASYHGSAHLLALCEANGFIEIPVGVGALAAGEEVRFHPLMPKTV